MAQETDARPKNPLLCDNCQIWDNVNSYAEWWPYPERFDPLQNAPENVQCMICKAAMTAITARVSQMNIPQTSRVLFRNNGPYFLDHDTGDPADSISHRIDTSDPSESVVRLLMGLMVKVEPAASTVTATAAQSEQSEFEMTPQFCLRYEHNDPQSSLKSVEPWEVPLFDVSLLKQWLQGCAKIHGAECRRNIETKLDELPRGFRVINLNTMNVEVATSALTYVTLSYRWPPEKDSERVQLEKGNCETLERPGGLAKIALPPIITDTMLLCKQLGENYLWIDRFCIIQDDPDSKHGQIRGMDRIYRCANFTIMAALSGQEAWGLPGLVGRPRVSSVYKPASKFDVELREIKPKWLSAAETSIWNTRGWTFQERVLSTRRLYITEHEALFECCLGCASEDLAHYPPHQRANRGNAPEDEFRELPGFFRWPDYGRGVNYHITDNTSLRDYLDWVANYTSRQLSFGSDVLNAFSGIGNLLGQVLGSNLIFCLPEKFLVQALMWTASDNIVMRTGIPENLPSWSWASFPSKVNYKWITEDKEDYLHVISLVYFYIQDVKEGLRKVEAQEWWVEGEMAIEDFRNRDDVPLIENISEKYLPGDERTSTTWKECPHNPWQTLLHTILDLEACKVASSLPGSLVFNTTVAKVMLSLHSFTTSRGEPVEQMMVLDSNGEKMGMIKGALPPGEKQEVIVICGALAGRSARKMSAKYFRDFDQWRLHVMVVERNGPSPCVVRRVRVGYVGAHKWKGCAPTWETVVLC
ncbi:hypothetical protein CDV31_010450 [Fusarium ambrosium]|uniref:Heterokaryon incompatibility domain-containing protein n=1 Tax=Fusarium ambrosium TaxID=131363 RepID=A0A428TNE4_9HYPO|nr:hypothetical protein CDV31_010450 [Fusarium ambrosium]